jgi:pimeloyl-ACP methyl ester carboxylesterase
MRALPEVLDRPPETKRMMRFRSALFLTLLFAPSGASAGARLHLSPCRIGGAGARCGTFDVPESPGSARTIALKLVVLPATKRNESPIFFFSGGPGEATTDGAADEVKFGAAERRLHDVVLVDERGAGGSHPIDCPTAKKAHEREFVEGDLFPSGFVADCRSEIEPHADLHAYTYPYFVRDVEELRRALGYKRINIGGFSYGTRAALTFLQAYPSSVRSLFLNGPLPPENTPPLNYAADTEALLHTIVDDCASDPECVAAFPDVRGDLTHAFAQLAAHPADVMSGGYHLRISEGAFGEYLRSSMYSAEGQTLVPLIVHLAATSQWDVLAPRWIRYRQGWYDYVAKLLAVACPTDVRWIDPKAVAPATTNTLLGDYRIQRQTEACSLWTPGTVARLHVPFDAHVPILIVTGDRDPVTPLRWATITARNARRSRVIVLKNSGHVELNDCSLAIETRFFDTASPETIDAACASTLPHLPFATTLPAAK